MERAKRALAAALKQTVDCYRADREEILALVQKRRRRILEPLPHAPDVTLLHECLLLAAHTSYHLGQIVVVRRALRSWSQ